MTMETTNNTGKNQNNQQKSARKCRSHLNHKSFTENFIYDPLKMSTKPMGDITLWDISG